MLNAAMVGLGWWGRVMVDSVQWTSDKIRFTDGVVRNRDRARAFADSRRLTLLPSLDAALDTTTNDAIVLATPHSLHVDQIIACAQAGKPVFSEKPLGLTLADARRAVAACDAAGVPFGLGTDRRLLPALVTLKTMVDAGDLGDLLHLEAQYSNDNMSRAVSGDWRNSQDEAPGAGMTGPGLHALDALIHLAGPLAKISGQILHPKGDREPVDAVSLLLRFKVEATGLLGCVRGVPNYFRVAVFGTKGWAEMRGFGDLYIHLHDRHPWQERHDETLAVRPLLDAFATAVEGGAPFPVSTLSMLQTVAAFETAIKCLAVEGPVDVPPVEVPNVSAEVPQ